MSTTTAFRDTLYSENAPARAGAAPSTGGKPAAPQQSAAEAKAGIGVRLHPADGTERAVVANYVNLVPASGMAFLDFGFIEPLLLHSVDRAAQEGQELPQVLDGRLLTRVALGYDVMGGLAAQLEQLIMALRGDGEKQ